MQDLTKGSITGHLLSMAAFIGAGLIFQTLYFLVDLYFVSHLGEAQIAGVSAAGVTFYLVLASSQLVSVGAMALVAQAFGRRDGEDADLVFNQAFSLSLVMGLITLVLGYTLARPVMNALSADRATADSGCAYLYAFLPALALMFPSVTLSSSLRGAGVVGAPMFVQSGSVLINIALAPVLIAGWGGAPALGVAGAGLASSIAGFAGMIALYVLFPRLQAALRVAARKLAPRLDIWRRVIAVGLPTAGEFSLLFIIFGVIYWVIRDFGPHAQAGFGIGQRLLQATFLPAMAIAFAAAPIVGQNYGAESRARVIETFRQTAIIGSALMLSLTVLCIWRPDLLARFFTQDPETVEIAANYLRITAWTFVSSGLVFACSAVFQGLGDTRPALISSASRLLTFVVPALWLSTQSWAHLEDFWRLSVLSVTLQAALSLYFLRRQLNNKLRGLAPA